MQTLNIIFAIARKEFVDHLRNGWIIAVGLAFAIFSLLITFVGFGFTGSVGIGQEQTTLFSLINLVIYLVPLLGLLLSYDGIAGEQERGMLDLLRTYPFNTVHLFYGKWLGLFMVLTTTLVVGLAVPAAISVYKGYAAPSWILLLATSVWIGIIFNAIALMFSVLILERSKLIAIAIGIWLLFVVLFDLAVIGLLVYAEGDVPMAFVNLLFYLNPTALYRLLSIDLIMNDAMIQQLGLLGQIPPTPALIAAITAWTLIPIAIGGWRIHALKK
ncbi:ABC transporter permease [Pseudomonadota bacterium]